MTLFNICHNRKKPSTVEFTRLGRCFLDWANLMNLPVLLFSISILNGLHFRIIFQDIPFGRLRRCDFFLSCVSGNACGAHLTWWTFYHTLPKSNGRVDPRYANASAPSSEMFSCTFCRSRRNDIRAGFSQFLPPGGGKVWPLTQFLSIWFLQNSYRSVWRAKQWLLIGEVIVLFSFLQPTSLSCTP